MIDAHVYTMKSLQQAIQEGVPRKKWDDPPDREPGAVVEVGEGGIRFHVHAEDNSTTRLIVLFSDEGSDPMERIRPSARRYAAERLLKVSMRAEDRHLKVPPSWGSYHHGPFVSFFSCARGRDPKVPRWIVEVQRPSNDLCVWKMTFSDDMVVLNAFGPDEDRYFRAVAGWREAHAIAMRVFSRRTGETSLVGASELDLDTPDVSNVTKGLTFSGWLPHLTEVQRAFVDSAPVHSVKVRGPAGSGKTLALELKAISEVARAIQRGQPIHVLFATHSWAMADAIDSDLRLLDEGNWTGHIDVYPLLTLAQDALPAERWDSGLQLVGDDSFEGKQFQLDCLSALWADFAVGDWLTFRDSASASFRERVEDISSEVRKALVWDTLIEFGCVLGAEGIFPGAGAESRYLRLSRAPWMMPLESDPDRRVILHLYGEFFESLVKDGVITSDQLVNDFLSFLETFAWNVRRVSEGYDLIFVDELHLFNAQERMILRYLSRQPSEYPLIFMALDPRQSPWERYVGFSEIPGRGEFASSEEDLGEVGAVDLPTIHRFSPQILELVAHINHEFPMLELGTDWSIDYSKVTSAAQPGPKPVVVTCGTRDAELVEVVERADRRSRRSAGRVAIAIVDEERLPDFESIVDGLSKRAKRPVVVISSRDDLENALTPKRGIIVGPVEYLAGLQFETVIVAGIGDTQFAISTMGHRQRRFLSLLYLAVSRAEKIVEIIVTADDGGTPEILSRAVDRQLIDVERGREVA